MTNTESTNTQKFNNTQQQHEQNNTTCSNSKNRHDSTTNSSIRSSSLSIEVDQVGFSSLPEQVHRKSIKKGFEFTILVVGDSGLGKSTLINSLFMTDLYSDRSIDTVTDRIKKTVGICKRTTELEEKGVRLRLTVVDTPGFGDSINAQNSWKPIVNYVEEQFYSFYVHESGVGIDRKKLQDTRVHCCLYFLPPHIRGLRPLDIEVMQELQDKVNIVPVIGKADSLTKKEIDTLKQNILSDIEKYQIKIYEFPQCDSDDDDSFKKLDEEVKNAMPFALIGSNTIMEAGNKRIRGRVYPWGIVDIESDCCDFNKLRTFICSSHMQDLKDLTHDIHYENYRVDLIKSQQQRQLQNMQVHYESGFSKDSLDEKERLLRQKDLELKKMHEQIVQMKLQAININKMSNGQMIKSTSNFNSTQPNNSHNYVNVIMSPQARNYENTVSTQNSHHQHLAKHGGSNGVSTSNGASTFVLSPSNSSLLCKALNGNGTHSSVGYMSEYCSSKVVATASYSNSTPI